MNYYIYFPIGIAVFLSLYFLHRQCRNLLLRTKKLENKLKTKEEPVWGSQNICSNLIEIRKCLRNSNEIEDYPEYISWIVYNLRSDLLGLTIPKLKPDNYKTLIKIVMKSLELSSINDNKKEEFKKMGDYFSKKVRNADHEYFSELKDIYARKEHTHKTVLDLTKIIYYKIKADDQFLKDRRLECHFRNIENPLRDGYIKLDTKFNAIKSDLDDDLAGVINDLDNIECTACLCVSCAPFKYKNIF